MPRIFVRGVTSEDYGLKEFRKRQREQERIDALARLGTAHGGLGGALLEHTGADPVFDVVARAALDDDGVDAFVLEQAAEREAGGSGAEDDDVALDHHSILPSATAATLALQ